MDFLYLIVIVWFVIAIFLAIKKPYIRGKIGENFVSSKLHELDPEKYIVLNDVFLPSLGSTANTQIDHIVVSNFGIFCIETKSYKGWIFGTAKHRLWTQVIYKYKKKFYNPLRQNYAHQRSIELLVKPLFPRIPMVSYVVFPSAEKLKISGTDRVGNTRDTIEKIKRFNLPVISDGDRDQIVRILLDANIHDEEARKLHNRNVREVVAANRTGI